MFACCRHQTVTKRIVLAGIAVLALVMSVGSASAQNPFDSLFGRFNRAPTGPSTTAYADPFSWNPFGSRPAETPAPEMGGGLAYCVRLCDGRFFPIQRQSNQYGNQSPAQACSSFCPASQTRIYNGSSIDNSVGPDGKPYRELSTAFTYREKIVPGCTCNGKDAFGLVNTPVAEDPTLRPGDIVATNNGLMAYTGGTRKAANFTPVASYSGLSSDLRRKLTETKITPAAAIPTPPPIAPADVTGSIRNAKSKRVQVDR